MPHHAIDTNAKLLLLAEQVIEYGATRHRYALTGKGARQLEPQRGRCQEDDSGGGDLVELSGR